MKAITPTCWASTFLVTQRAAYLAYAHIQEVRLKEELSQKYLDKAAAVENLLTSKWWDKSNRCFYARLNKDYQLEGRAGDNLDWHAARRADPDAAYKHLVDAATSPRSRREYPEISFSWIGDMVNGTMGVNPLFTSPLQAAVKGNWVEVAVRTMPALASHVSWAELRHLPIRANGVAVRHEGNRKTRFTNQRGPALVWQAAFDGPHETLLVNGRPMKATVEYSTPRPVSWVNVIVGAGGTASVEVPPASETSNSSPKQETAK